MSKRRRLAGNRDFNEIDFLSREAQMFKDLDPDLKELFDDIRLPKSSVSKKRRKKKANFAIGDHVEVNGSYGTIIYGPYSATDDGKDSYEIETEDKGIVTASDDGKTIITYVPPVEEKEDDDIF
jgi:hypothetical protein